MNSLPSRFAVAVCFTLAAAAGDARANDDFAITGVAVLPMNSERVLEDRTVVIRDGVIASVDETATEVPDDIPVIDGRSRYLLPGLADLHVHLREEDELVNYLAWGVTTVMHFGGSGGPGLRQLELRREIEAGILLGPNILATDRILDGDPAIATGAHSVDSAEEARRIVRQLRDDGYDFVKIYNNVSQEVFHAIVDEAREQALPVFGHIPRNFDPLDSLANGLDAVAHTEELFFTYFGGPRSLDDMPADYVPDLDHLPSLVRVLDANRVALIPDLCFTFGNLMMWDDLEHVWQDPEFAWVHPSTASMWETSNIDRRSRIEHFVRREQWKYDLLQTLTLEFQRAGLLQVIGTDASLPGLFPGKAVHRELTELVKAGLTNFEALALGTRNAGVFVRRYVDPGARFGQVVPGYRADLLLLEENPLDDVRNARRVAGVAVNGRFVAVEELDRRRSVLEERYRALRELNADVDRATQSPEPAVAVARLLDRNAGKREAIGTIEARINAAGYAAGYAGDLDRAMVLFGLNTELFPHSANAWHSLAEAVRYTGDAERALGLYERVLKLDPAFPGVAEQVESLKAGNVE